MKCLGMAGKGGGERREGGRGVVKSHNERVRVWLRAQVGGWIK